MIKTYLSTMPKQNVHDLTVVCCSGFVMCSGTFLVRHINFCAFLDQLLLPALSLSGSCDIVCQFTIVLCATDNSPWGHRMLQPHSANPIT